MTHVIQEPDQPGLGGPHPQQDRRHPHLPGDDHNGGDEEEDGNEGVQDPEHYGAKEDLTEDHGTCQHSFLSPDGDAVSVTASINLIWGCKFMSPSTGIIMNNQVMIYLFILSTSSET